MRTWVVRALCAVVVGLIVACGGHGGAGGACIVSQGTAVIGCISWNELPSNFTPMDACAAAMNGADGATVNITSSCPGDSVGTCALNLSGNAQGIVLYSESYSPITCADAQTACSETNGQGDYTTSFTGNGC